MKKCVECDAEVADDAFTCPVCGGKNMIGAYSGTEALGLLETMKSMSESATHVDKAARFYVQGKLDEAVKELNRALEIAPKNATAHGNMGAILIAKGKPTEAIPWLEKALELNPGLEGVPAALAQAKSASSGSSKCFVATACYGDPEDPDVRLLRAYRDLHLQHSRSGRLFIKAYTFLSPPIARWLRSRPGCRAFVRRRLIAPIVQHIRSRHGD
ncbi:MAG: CFI-box-CTERM domain-containing protein [Planctomycetota bacterium]